VSEGDWDGSWAAARLARADVSAVSVWIGRSGRLVSGPEVDDGAGGDEPLRLLPASLLAVGG
jgi:hypothetical protein